MHTRKIQTCLPVWGSLMATRSDEVVVDGESQSTEETTVGTLHGGSTSPKRAHEAESHPSHCQGRTIVGSWAGDWCRQGGWKMTTYRSLGGAHRHTLTEDHMDPVPSPRRQSRVALTGPLKGQSKEALVGIKIFPLSKVSRNVV